MIEHIGRWRSATGVAAELAEAIRDRALAAVRLRAAIAAARGILLADTKFEFGLVDRATDAASIADPHRRGADARFVALLGCCDLRAGPAAGELRQAVRARLARDPAVGQDRARARRCPTTSSTGTRARYVEAYERITGASFERYLQEDVIAP